MPSVYLTLLLYFNGKIEISKFNGVRMNSPRKEEENKNLPRKDFRFPVY